MEVAAVRQRVLAAIARARRAAADRRTRSDEGGREYSVFLETVAAPLFHQVAAALRAEGYHFNVFTPGGSVRLMSDRSADDYIELVLDTTGDRPLVMGRTSRARGQRGVTAEHPLNESGSVREISEEAVLEFLVKALEPFVEK